MGFFSWDCKGCGRSVRSSGLGSGSDGWMAKAVVLTKRGSVIVGEYDGYGRVDSDGGETEIQNIKGGPEVWHEACWEHAGRPKYTGPSRSSADQGCGETGEFDWYPPNTNQSQATREGYLLQLDQHLKHVFEVMTILGLEVQMPIATIRDDVKHRANLIRDRHRQELDREIAARRTEAEKAEEERRRAAEEDRRLD